jgi:uncharacterized protein YhaN
VKITALEVEGFGAWRGLGLDGFTEGLNVFFGPNEAGKTTLMQFLRSVLYGFSPDRRRYLPPARGGRPGGWVEVDGPNGRFRIARHANQQPPGADLVTLTAPDGTRQGEHFLKVLLYGIDEKIFNHVFAIGLGELQELATLSDTEAASHLYHLSAGLGQVSFADVMRELDASRNRLLDSRGGACQIGQLLAQADQLRRELEQAGGNGRRYARLAAEQERLDRDIARLEEENGRTQQQVRLLQLAALLLPRWQRREALRAEVELLGPAAVVSEKLLKRLEAVERRIASRETQLEAVSQRRAELHREIAGVKLSRKLHRLAPGIESLREQEAWIGTLEERIAARQREIDQWEAQLSEHRRHWGLEGGPEVPWPAISPQSLAALRGPARQLHRCHAAFTRAEQDKSEHDRTADSTAAAVRAGLEAHGEDRLPDALGRQGGLVAQLRRRVQLDGRLEKMEQYRAELGQRCRYLLGQQLLPMWTVAALGAVAVLGAVFAMVGLLVPRSILGSAGWLMVVVGLAGAIAAVAARVIMDRRNARQLAACEKQLEMLQLQSTQASREREELDAQIPGDAPVAERLKAAENRLVALEAMVPLDAARQSAAQSAAAAAERAARARGDLDSSRRRWRDAVAALGLPPQLSPKRIGQLAASYAQIAECQRNLDQGREEREQRQRELAGIGSRITQWAAESGLELTAQRPAERLRELVSAVEEHHARLERRQALRGQWRKLGRRQEKLQAARGRDQRRRRMLLRRAGVAGLDQLRQKADQYQRTAELRRERDALSEEIAAALAGQFSEETLQPQMQGAAAESLSAERGQWENRLEAAAGELRSRLEDRGRLGEQLRALAEDRTTAARRLELTGLEKRREEAIHRWQVLAVTQQVLQGLRDLYQRDRQPETLQEASEYLRRMTEGRYQRVWTPLGESLLRVDRDDETPMAVEAMSQGGREQLFLCLRLALADRYARRGAALPMVLDDVLVNFDESRAKAAIDVLRDFGGAGHQLFVFTCHEHLARLFKAAEVRVRRLPSSGRSETPTTATPEAGPKPRRRRRGRSEPESDAAPAAPESEPDQTEPDSPARGSAEVEEDHDGAEAA